MVLATRVDPKGMIRVFEKLEEEQHRQLKSLEKDKKPTGSKEKKPAEKSAKKKDEKEKDKEENGKEEKGSDKEGITLPEWTKYLSTHPEGEDRVTVLKKMSKNLADKPRPLLPGFDWKTMHRETKETGFIF